MNPLLHTLTKLPAQPIAQPLIHALGWTLLHFLWQGALVAALLWFALGLLPAQLSRTRYAAALCALALMAGLPLATFSRLAARDLTAARALALTPIPIDSTLVLSVTPANTPEPLLPRIQRALDDSIPWLPALWLAGVVLFLARLNLGLLIARRMANSAALAPPDELQRIFDALRGRLRISRPVRLMHSAIVQVPTVIGWLRPVVLVPVGCLAGMSAIQVEAILAHELAHIRRHDYLVSVLQSLIEALLFYQPAVWWVSRQLRRERENCCDDLAVAIAGDPLAYARALSSLEERRALMPSLALAASGGALKSRIRRLLGCPDDRVALQPAAVTMLVVAVLASVTYLIATAHAQPTSQPSAPTSADPTSNPGGPSYPALSDRVGYRAKLDPPSLNGPAPQALAQDQTTTPDEAALAQAVQEYRQFIATYPDSPEAAEARKRLTEIEAAPPGIQKRLAYAQAATETAKARVFYALPPGGHQLSAYLRKVQSDLAASSRDQQPGSATPAQQSSSPPLELFLDVPDAPHEPMRSIPNVLSSMVDPVPEPAKEKHVQGQVVLQPGPVPPLDEAAAGVKQFGGDVKPPAIISEPQPEYTDLARTDKVQGAVLVSLVVDEHGLPRHVRVLRGLGDGLDEKAIEAVNRYHFKPAMQNDKPVPVYATIDVNFALPAPAAQRADAASPAAPIPPADAPARVPSGALADNLISKVDPVYPEIARAAHVQGAVILHALISKTGTVEKLNVISGPPMLVKSAMDAVQQWKYKPYIVNGQPVEVSTTITVNFALADQPAAASPPSSTPTLFVNSTDADAAAADTQAEQRDRDRAANLRKIGGTVSAPVLMYEVEPKFSEDARKAKVAGTVLVSLIVDPSGLPQNVHVVRGIEIGPDGKPNPTLTDEARAAAATLDQNAVDAVNKYKFKPAMEDGKPVPVLLNIEINYKLF